MSVERAKDRKDETIQEGDHVWTRFRGGVREGEVWPKSSWVYTTLASLLITDDSCTMQVQKVVLDEHEARKEEVANPPKVSLVLVMSKEKETSRHGGWKRSILIAIQVIFTDQHGHRVAHNPTTLSKTG